MAHMLIKLAYTGVTAALIGGKTTHIMQNTNTLANAYASHPMCDAVSTEGGPETSCRCIFIESIRALAGTEGMLRRAPLTHTRDDRML
jgi:hypothetical protein